MSETRLPTVYLPHGGGPWPFVELPIFDRSECDALAQALRSQPQQLGAEPKALLVISAHWEEAVATVTTAAQPPIYYDYYGFPPEAYRIEWPAPGHPQLAERVRDTAFGVYSHQDVPFERIVERIDPPRDFSHNPVFQVMFSFHDAPVPDLDFENGLWGELEYTHNGSAKFDMNLIVIPRGEQRVGRAQRAEDESDVIIEWEHNRDLFDEETVRRFARHFRQLLEAACANPDQAISRMSMLDDEERNALLSRFEGELREDLALFTLERTVALPRYLG